MSKSILLLILCLFVLSSCDKKPDKRGFKADFSEIFKNDTGSFILYDFNNRYYLIHNEEQTKEKYSPGQTYIYLSSLNFLNKYKSSGLKSGEVSDSITLAKLIDSTGLEIQKKSITENNYGNKDTSFINSDFYYNSGLKISTSEQVEFIKELYISNENFKTIKNDFVTDTVKARNVSYIVSSDNEVSWCVGTVEYGSNIYVFALNILSSNKLRALEITQKILYSVKILEELK
ncbi:MAG TPA: hypothetical protein PLG90_04585 [Ignavibacteria bacterium]|nr:hypothetical protein [Ignavibacteria bacterium]